MNRMNNREAITLLRNLEDSLDSYCELNEEGKTAFRMAIEALNCSEFPNNSDTISRQAALDALGKTSDELYENIKKGATFPQRQWFDGMAQAQSILENLPSAQPEPLILPDIYVAKDYDSVESEDGSAGFGVYIPSEKQIYVAGDVPNEVFVKALFHELLHWVQDATGNPFDEDEANAFADRIYYALQSSQPDKETAKRVLWSGWKGYRNTRYKCPTCKKPVKNDDVYCHRCGQKLMFPHIDHTPYVPGEKQELIVRWDDE